MKKHICTTTLDIIGKARRGCLVHWDWGGESSSYVIFVQSRCRLPLLQTLTASGTICPSCSNTPGQRGWGHCLTTPLLECRRPFQSGRGGVDVVKVNIIHQTCMWRCVLLARVCAGRLLALTTQETTANTLSFAVVLTCLHPEVQGRLVSEVDEVLGAKTSVSAEDLERLQYTEQVTTRFSIG